ncbi:MAG: GNAT family N-acetyltransferase [Bacteroidetes bacterium]|nr:GNAT family N-acetyltransferase [Bacteroidota bacterium]MBL0064940.1 GNAT family N-acetyltransferase [Bacteroidota bacterium]MBL0137100.1 GNAT family N-acetyltransferase [Bacteroidota bacterium]
MRYILETERLFLREFSTEDAPFVVQLVNSPGWLEFIGDRNIRNDEQARIYLENGPLLSYKQNGYGLSLVELKHGKTPIGMCGIINRENLENPDIGFAFLPEHMGQGFAFEVAQATMKYARENLKLPTVCAITVSGNLPSIKLLEKLGMKFSKMINFPDDPVELMLYRMDY